MRQLLQHLFKLDTLQELPLEKLREFTQRHPSCNVGQFLLAKKLKQTGDTEASAQFQKTLLYFNNPLWLNHQLSTGEEDLYQPDLQTRLEDQVTGKRVEEPVVLLRDLFEDVITHQEKIYPTPESIDEQQAEDSTLIPDVMDHTLALSDAAPGQSDKTTEQSAHDIRPVPGEPGGGLPPSTEQKAADEEFTFQAYHTVDYFASQGIKLNPAIQPDDKLGKQLKSFTEWLKTMRRVPQASVEEALEKPENRDVERFAAHSLEENEVVTEAMAEVLAKQGMHEQASTVYRKLSLRNPQKSAYFASKIQDLNLH